MPARDTVRSLGRLHLRRTHAKATRAPRGALALTVTAAAPPPERFDDARACAVTRGGTPTLTVTPSWPPVGCPAPSTAPPAWTAYHRGARMGSSPPKSSVVAVERLTQAPLPGLSLGLLGLVNGMTASTESKVPVAATSACTHFWV